MYDLFLVYYILCILSRKYASLKFFITHIMISSLSCMVHHVSLRRRKTTNGGRKIC